MRKTPSEREDAGSLLGPVTLSFPSQKFPFSLPEGLALLRTHLTSWGWNPGGKIHCSWVGSLHQPTPVVPPWDLAKKLRWAPGRTLHLPCWTDTHTPAPISSFGYRVSEIPFSQILSLSLAAFPSPSPGRPYGPSPWPCAPSDFEIGSAHFKAGYSYSLRRLWERGCLFSQTFLLTFSRPCLPCLFGCNGKFSIPALKIYSSRMPCPKPKGLGLPRED